MIVQILLNPEFDESEVGRAAEIGPIPVPEAVAETIDLKRHVLVDINPVPAR